MRIIIGCEFSQVICKAFRARGHEAYSCDIIPCEGGHPEWHYQEDILVVLEREYFDMGIFHPECTDLAVSGAAWFKEKRKDGRQQRAIDMFMKLVNALPKNATENPVGIMSTLYRKPDQIIQPWQFGHMEQKKTCLWLRGLPPLITTENVYDEMMLLPKNKRERLHYLPPAKDRAKIRSITYQGIADAMAEQWGV